MKQEGNRILASESGFGGFEWTFNGYAFNNGTLELNFNDGAGESANFWISNNEEDEPLEFLDGLIFELQAARQAYAAGILEPTEGSVPDATGDSTSPESEGGLTMVDEGGPDVPMAERDQQVSLVGFIAPEGGPDNG